MIRVGKVKYEHGVPKYPSYEGYTSIIVMMKSHSKWSSLSPYTLTDKKGRIFENIWQFSKCYEKVPKSVQKYSRYDNRIIWEHKAETHIENDELTEEYFKWRKKGMNNEFPVRYPVGYSYRSKCKFSVTESGKRLNYIEARKEIYLKKYINLVRKTEDFEKLKKKLDNGENLLIIEVDGPHQESLEYYIENYGVTKKFIKDDTVRVNKKNMKILLNDPKHPFGHGYCLAVALLDLD